MVFQITARTAAAHFKIVNEMFCARKQLFGDRLGWDVQIDAQGRETDRYDTPSAHYLIAVDDNNNHQGSLRLLPTTGDTILHSHFAVAFDGLRIESSMVWECTRFCVNGMADEAMTSTTVERVTANLLLGMCEMGIAKGLTQITGLFNGQTIEIYRRAGWSPNIISKSGEGDDALCLGMWEISRANAASIRKTSGIIGSVFKRQNPSPSRPDAALG